MALEDATETMALGSYVLWAEDSAENGGLIKDSDFSLYFPYGILTQMTPESITETYANTGVNVLEVSWTDSTVESEESESPWSTRPDADVILYYSLNLGISADPAVDTSSDDFSAGTGGEYPVTYKSNEKTALLTQYKRYASVSGTPTTFAEALSDSIADIVEYTVKNAITIGNLMNFKKVVTPLPTTTELSVFSKEELSPETSIDISSMTKTTTTSTAGKGGY